MLVFFTMPSLWMFRCKLHTCLASQRAGIGHHFLLGLGETCNKKVPRSHGWGGVAPVAPTERSCSCFFFKPTAFSVDMCAEPFRLNLLSEEVLWPASCMRAVVPPRGNLTSGQEKEEFRWDRSIYWNLFLPPVVRRNHLGNKPGAEQHAISLLSLLTSQIFSQYIRAFHRCSWFSGWHCGRILDGWYVKILLWASLWHLLSRYGCTIPKEREDLNATLAFVKIPTGQEPKIGQLRHKSAMS